MMFVGGAMDQGVDWDALNGDDDDLPVEFDDPNGLDADRYDYDEINDAVLDR